jgi:hypothetical protein
MPDLPSLPRCSLTVAVIGNRRFADETDHGATAAAAVVKAHAVRACETVWRDLLAQLPRVLDAETVRVDRGDAASSDVPLRQLFSAEPPVVAVASSLAAGADQIGAEAALKAAADQRAVHVVLDVILPFADEGYPGDAPEFRPEETASLRSLQARARSVVRLDANYANPDEHVDAYRLAAQALLERADLLMAIYDPEKAGKGAGTRETIGHAQEAAVPVISILVGADGARVDTAVREPLIAALVRSGRRGIGFLVSRQDEPEHDARER